MSRFAASSQHRPELAPLDLSSINLSSPPAPNPKSPPAFGSSPAPYTAASGHVGSQYSNHAQPPASMASSSHSGTFANGDTHDSARSNSPHRLAQFPAGQGNTLLARGWTLTDPGVGGSGTGQVQTNGIGPASGERTRPLPSAPSGKSPVTPSGGKRPNPLEDLIHTETLYVADLGTIIKRVAGAWSRTNFPPPALDTMFRAVEAVYRINKGMLAKLNEIGPNPSSPKALGDLLMRWITDLTPAYSRFSHNYQAGFDTFEPVQRNEKLAPILASLDWPGTLPRSEDSTSPSMDQLFSLPVYRIAYYKKLYTKLLKSTQPGRSDHKLLVEANDQLDKLAEACREGKERRVAMLDDGPHPSRTPVDAFLPLLPPPPRNLPLAQPELPSIPAPAEDLRDSVENATPRSEERSSGDSRRMNSSASSLRSSRDTETSGTNTSAATHHARSATTRVEDLEMRLSTDRVLDIFTMQPKRCKLQMAPPNLTFVRQVRRAGDVSISFVPTCDPNRQELLTRNAHIILLTDLFLVCQYMSFEERVAVTGAGGEGPDLWLMYPPLSSKHLRVSDGPTKSEIEVVVMKREKLTIHVGDGVSAREWKAAFDDAAAFGAAQPGRTPSTSSHAPLSPVTPSDITHFNANAFPHIAEDGRLRSVLSNSAQPSPISGSLPFSGKGSLPRTPQEHEQRQYADGIMGYGPPPPRNASQHDQVRRAFSADPSSGAPLPPRNQSVYRNGPGPSSTSLRTAESGLSSLAASPAYPPSEYSRGPSPQHELSSSRSGYSDGRRSPHYNGRYSPHQNAPEFGHVAMAPHANGAYGSGTASPGPRSTSRSHNTQSMQSNGSLTSSWTDRSSFPEVPPIPEGRFDRYGSGRGYEPSVRTAPSRSGSGMLSPGASMYRSQSVEALRQDGSTHYRMPSAMLQADRSRSAPVTPEDYSPPTSPVDKRPEQTSVVAQMRTKIFLQQSPGQWKSLGTGKLKLFLSMPSQRKQIVVDTDKNKTIISTIVLADGTERVGKTGVAIELTDDGSRTGIVYMLQMKTEQAAKGLFDQLLLGSDRAARAAP